MSGWVWCVGQLFGSLPRAVECFGTMFEVDMMNGVLSFFKCLLVGAFSSRGICFEGIFMT